MTSAVASISDSDSALDAVSIRDESIRLGQLLKLHGVADNGVVAKELIAAGDVTVNGEVERRRGRSIEPGDVVECAGETFTVVQG